MLERVSESSDLLSRPGPVRLIRMDIDPTDPSSGGYKLRVALGGGPRLDVYERLVGGSVVKCSYSLIRGEDIPLRYDNAPHHRGLETHPHHRHVGLNYTTGELDLQIPNATYEVAGNVSHEMIDWAVDGEYGVELVARGSGNYTLLAVESVGGIVTDYVLETGNVTEGETITYEFSTADLNATLSFLPGEVRPRMPALANVTLVNSGTLNVTWVNVTHHLPQGYVRYVDHASAFLEVNGTVYRSTPWKCAQRQRGTVKIRLNFSAGGEARRAGRGRGGPRPRARLCPEAALPHQAGQAAGPGSHGSSVTVERPQESAGTRAGRLSTASAEPVVRARGRCSVDPQSPLEPH